MQELFPGTKEALDNLSLYNTNPVFEDVDDFELEMEHFDDLKTELGYAVRIDKFAESSIDMLSLIHI